MSPWERRLLRTEIGALSPQDQIDASWRMECVAVLLWALRLIDDIPSLDHQADTDLLKEVPPGPPWSPVLRSVEEIDRARDLAELWHWRSWTRQLQEEGQDLGPIAKELALPGIKTVDDLVRLTAKRAREEGQLSELIDEDFLVRGKAFRNFSREEWSEIRSMIHERLFALNWLCGYAPGNRWDKTPTDTKRRPSFSARGGP